MSPDRTPRRPMIVCLAAALAAAVLGPPGRVQAQGQAAAQSPSKTVSVDPGMTREQVVDRLGEPSEESHAGSFTYLMYDNECGQKCGMDDLVILERGAVADAIFRSGKRIYTGTSSSPHPLPPSPPTHFAPEPIRASTAADSANRGGIVIMGPRPPARPSRYVRVTPNHADSARMASGASGAPAAPTTTPPDTAATRAHE
jgi:hypothetical protein